MNYKGSCHCGDVSYEVEFEREPDEAMECNCTYCSRKGNLLWFAPRDKLKITQGEGKLATYTFNKHVIQHEFCPRCGIGPFGFGKDPKGNLTAAINVRCLEDVDPLKVKRKFFDGLKL
jgi:hypothetical protein